MNKEAQFSLANRKQLAETLTKYDLTGVFCTSESEREFTLEGSWYADQEI